MSYFLEITDGQARALQADLNEKYPLEETKPTPKPAPSPKPPPSQKPVIKPIPKPPVNKSPAKLVTFASVWGNAQPSGNVQETQDPYIFRSAAGIAISLWIPAGKKIKFSATESTSGGASVPEISISLTPGDYETALDYGKGNYDRVNFKNTTSDGVRVFANARIRNYSDDNRASMLIISIR